MNNNISRNDFLFFQNEVFQDLKNLESKINERINTMSTDLVSFKQLSTANFQNYTEQIAKIISKIENTDEKVKLNTQLSSFQTQINDISYMIKARLNALEKEISNISFKYDRIFLENLIVPGIVGNACPYHTMAEFIDYSNKKIKELLIEKEKQNKDMKTYKDRLETIIGSFTNQIKNVENKFGEYCNNSLKSYEKNAIDRNNLLDEKIEAMRIENGKYSFNLIKKADEINIDWEKLQKIKDEIYTKFNEELNKYSQSNNNLCKIFNTQRDEFRIIKDRFTELSEFIKDVRFRNNLNAGNDFGSKTKFKNMAKRINFKLKQKFETTEDKNSPLEESNKNNIEVKENNNSKQKKKESLVNKPIILNKVSSTLKDYFNQNREYKSLNHNKSPHKNNNSNTNSNILSNVKSENNKENDNAPSKFGEIVKPLTGLTKNIDTIFESEHAKTNKNFEVDRMNLNIEQSNKSKSTRQIQLIKELSNIFTIDKSRNINELNNIINNLDNDEMAKTLNSENNINYNLHNSKALKDGFKKLNNIKKITIDSSKKGINNESKGLISSNSQNQIFDQVPTLTLNQLENFVNSIINKRNNINDINDLPLNERKKYISKYNNIYNDKNSDKNNTNSNMNNNDNNYNNDINEKNNENSNKNDNININNNKDNKDNKDNNKKNSIDYKNKTITNNYYINYNNKNYHNKNKNIHKNYDNNNKIKNFDNDNNNKGNDEDKKEDKNNDNNNLMIKNYSFTKNGFPKKNKKIYINNDCDLDMKEKNLNLDILNKKIYNTNNRINEMYQIIDTKIKIIYKYIRKLFEDKNGKTFFKENTKLNIFNTDISPKNIISTIDANIPPQFENKNKVISLKNEKQISKIKYHTPEAIKAMESFKTIVNHIEPYLIKKFKE